MSKKLSLIFFICVSLVSLAWATAYSDGVVFDSPLSYWQFEDATSGDGDTCADTMTGYYTDGGSPGVYRNRGGYMADISLVTSLQGKAAQFTGTADSNGTFVQIYDSSYSTVPYRLSSSPSCTLELGMKHPTLESELYARLYSHADGGTANYWLGITTTGDNAGQPFVGVPGNTWYAWPPILADDEWHHVVVTYTYNDPNTVTELWIDGVSRGTREDPGQLTSVGDWQDLIFGAEGNPYYIYNGYEGLLDEIAYYDYVLSDARIEMHAGLFPEPATIALLGLGGLLLRRRRR
jgi:hypothetical protein